MNSHVASKVLLRIFRSTLQGPFPQGAVLATLPQTSADLDLIPWVNELHGKPCHDIPTNHPQVISQVPQVISPHGIPWLLCVPSPVIRLGAVGLSEAQYHGCGHQLLPDEGGQAAAAAETPQRRGLFFFVSTRTWFFVQLKGLKKTTKGWIPFSCHIIIIIMIYYGLMMCKVYLYIYITFEFINGPDLVVGPGRSWTWFSNSNVRHTGLGKVLQIQAWQIYILNYHIIYSTILY